MRPFVVIGPIGRQSRLRLDRLKPHHPHQPLHPLGIDSVAHHPRAGRHPQHPIERALRELFVDQPHEPTFLEPEASVSGYRGF